jgi:intraflagellar transport protein 172
VEQAIDYATESGSFDHAFQLANASKKEKLPEDHRTYSNPSPSPTLTPPPLTLSLTPAPNQVHLKYAMYLEDEGRFDEAEKAFIQVRGQPVTPLHPNPSPSSRCVASPSP